MLKHNVIIIFMVLSSSLGFSQKVVFREKYKSIVDVDNNNWQYSIEFKAGDTAEYIGRSKVDKNYFKVKARGVVVFAYESSFIDIDKNIERDLKAQSEEESKILKEKIRLQDEQIANALKEKEREKAKVIKERNDRIKTKYGQAVLDRLQSEGLYIGMPEGLVREYLGEPRTINRTVTTNGASEQWVYNNRYCYIENGKLTSFQESY